MPDQARLSFILRGRELGFSIEDLRSLLALIDSGDVTCAEVLELTQRHPKTIRRKIAELQHLEVTLGDIAAKCAAGTAPDCPIMQLLRSE